MLKRLFLKLYQTFMTFVDDYHPLARRLQAMGFQRAGFSQRYSAPLYLERLRLVGVFTAQLAQAPSMTVILDIYSDIYQPDLANSFHEPKWRIVCSFADDKKSRGLFGTRNVSEPFELEQLHVKLTSLIQAPLVAATLLKKLQKQTAESL